MGFGLQREGGVYGPEVVTEGRRDVGVGCGCRDRPLWGVAEIGNDAGV